MYYSFSIFILFYFAIILSCLGYGIFISQKLENYLKIECLGFKGLIGIFFLLIYSYISHFMIPHGLLHNSILMLIGLLFFTYYAINSKFRGMKILFFTFSILFLSFLIFKTHDDFPYYHFPYTYNLTQNSMIIGIGGIQSWFKNSFINILLKFSILYASCRFQYVLRRCSFNIRFWKYNTSE